MTDRRRKRDPYAEVGERARATIEAATAANITARQLRTLLAVLHYTATRSLFGTHVWLGQLASITYAVERSEEWHQHKVREDLAALRRAGILDVEAPRGRPKKPSYWVALLDPSAPRNQGARRTPQDQGEQDTPAHPETRVSVEHPDPVVAHPNPGVSAPRNQGAQTPVAHPENGTPTEGFPEDVVRGETPEEEPSARPTPPDGGSSTDDETERWDDTGDALDAVIDHIADGHPDALDDAGRILLWLAPLPIGIRAELATTLRDHPPDHTRIRTIARTARTTAATYNLDLPPIEFPPRPRTRSTT